MDLIIGQGKNARLMICREQRPKEGDASYTILKRKFLVQSVNWRLENKGVSIVSHTLVV